MEKVFETHAQRKGMQRSSCHFLLDGDRINEDQTAQMLQLKDLDQIDCVLEQGGPGVRSVEITLPLQYRSIMSDDRESNPRNKSITIRIKDQVRCT